MTEQLNTQEREQAVQHVLTAREMIDKLKERGIGWAAIMAALMQGLPALISLFNMIFNPKTPIPTPSTLSSLTGSESMPSI